MPGNLPGKANDLGVQKNPAAGRASRALHPLCPHECSHPSTGSPGHSQDNVTPIRSGTDTASDQSDDRFGGYSCVNSRLSLKKIHFQAA